MNERRFPRARRDQLYEALKEYVRSSFPSLLSYYAESPGRMRRVDKLFHQINARAGALDLLNDKFLFNSLVQGAGYFAPEILAVTSVAGFYSVERGIFMSVDDGVTSLHGALFVKARWGSLGQIGRGEAGCMPIQIPTLFIGCANI